MFPVTEIFLEVAIFLETYPVLKNSLLHAWLTTMVGWKTKPLGFGPARTFTILMISYFQNCSILKFIFYSHGTWNLYAQIYFNSNTNVHIYLLPVWKINNVPGRNSYRKAWLLIHSLLKLLIPLFYRQPPIWSTTFYILSHPSPPLPHPTFENIYLEICPNEIQDKNTKNSQEEVISSKQHYMSILSNTFISKTRWDLIQYNNNLRYYKELHKNSSNCIEPPAFKYERYRVKFFASLPACKKSAQFISSMLRYSIF